MVANLLYRTAPGDPHGRALTVFDWIEQEMQPSNAILYRPISTADIMRGTLHFLRAARRWPMPWRTTSAK